MKQRKIFQFGVLALIFLMPLLAQAQKGEKIQTIVIDAGHGGKDTGALGKVTTEKALNLAVALKFGNYIKENMPDVKVVYTRDKDKFVELSERAAIANRNNADVFISIHCNSTEVANSAYGAETFVMGESKNEKNLEVAKKENAAILLEDNTDAYDNFDPNSTEAYIIFSLAQSMYQNQSLNLADKVQKQFANKVGRNDRGVQQAGFLVLWKTSMPSILVELGFINNAKEEQFLNSPRGQSQMALALYRAFEEYKREFEAENHVSAQPKSNDNNPAVKENTYFTVQFSTLNKKVPVTDKAFKGVKEVEVYDYKGAYRYTSGRFQTKAEAVSRQEEVRNLGYKDAFIIAFKNGERVSLEDAEKALKK
jgi:N-acetylmuramoyl-L-alanine amidase